MKYFFTLFILISLTSISFGQHSSSFDALENIKYYNEINSNLITKSKSSLTQCLLLDSIFEYNAMGRIWTAIEYDIDSRVTDVYGYNNALAENNAVHIIYSYNSVDSLESTKKVEFFIAGPPTISQLSATTPVKIQHSYIYNNSNYLIEDDEYMFGVICGNYIMIRDDNNNILSCSNYYMGLLSWKSYSRYNSFNKDTLHTFHNTIYGRTGVYLLEGTKFYYNSLQQRILRKEYNINIYDSTHWYLNRTIQLEYDTFGNISKSIAIDDSIRNSGNFKVVECYYYHSATALDSMVLTYGSDIQAETKRKYRYYYSNFADKKDSIYSFDIDTLGNSTLYGKRYFEYDSLGNLLSESKWSYNFMLNIFVRNYLYKYFYSYHIVNSQKEVDIQSNQFKVYPNPATNQVKFSLKQGRTRNITVQIFDIYGKLRMSKDTYDVLSIELNTSMLEKGVFIYRVIYNNEIQSGKLIIN